MSKNPIVHAFNTLDPADFEADYGVEILSDGSLREIDSGHIYKNINEFANAYSDNSYGGMSRNQYSRNRFDE